jgi:hypothetical protein
MTLRRLVSVLWDLTVLNADLTCRSGMTNRYIKHLNHPPVHFSRIILVIFAIIPYVVTVCVFLSVNKTRVLELNFQFYYRKWHIKNYAYSIRCSDIGVQ